MSTDGLSQADPIRGVRQTYRTAELLRGAAKNLDVKGVRQTDTLTTDHLGDADKMVATGARAR